MIYEPLSETGVLKAGLILSLLKLQSGRESRTPAASCKHPQLKTAIVQVLGLSLWVFMNAPQADDY